MTTASVKPPASRQTVADALEHTLEWLDQHGGNGTRSERRTNQRSRYRVLAQITYLPPGAKNPRTVEVVTRNLSRNGLSFIHRQLIYPRQAVEIHLPLPDRSVRQLTGHVVRVRPAGTDLYEIGIEFTEMEVAVA